MRIGTKLLILLLVIALGPLIAVSQLQRRATARLGDELATQVRRTLADDAELQLEQLVDDYGVILRLDREIIELALRAQARQVEKCLAADPPQERPRVYFSRDFDLGGTASLDMVLSPRHFTAPGGAEATPLPVTYSEQVFQLAPGVKLEDVADDVARLTAMVPTYRFLTEKHADLFYWNFTSLENGVHSSYPGHGGSPAEYDPRKLPWYEQARQADDLTWTGPTVDASSHRVLMTAALRVRRPDGSFAGVTAIDVPLNDLLDRVRLPARWGSEANIMLVSLSTARGQKAPSLLIVAQQGYRGRQHRWDIPIDLEVLESEDREQFDHVVEDMTRRGSGVERMRYRGRESLWAYGLVHDQGLYLVVIAPHDQIVAEAVSAERTVLGLTLQQLEVTGVVLGGMILIVTAIAVVVSGRITRPVREMAGAARRIAEGDLQTHVKVASHDELGELARSFNTMVPELQDSMRMRQSLALAMQVQRNLLPERAPQIEGLDVAGTSIFCDETSGDYYDFLELSRLGPRQLGVAVGDVTGHGIAAALLMATVRALLRSHAIHPGDLGQIMADINGHLTADTRVGQFTTLFYAVIDATGRTIRWTNAGHDPAIIYSPATDSFSELGGAGIPLGIEAGTQYTELSRNALATGEIIVIGTDGIWEMRNGDGRRFGKEALRDVVRRHAGRSAGEISRAITDSLDQFRRTHPQEDDVTLVVIKIVEARASSRAPGAESPQQTTTSVP
jgi:sigma-B regulation protein RsbU (phosphoserine phosphatase)